MRFHNTALKSLALLVAAGFLGCEGALDSPSGPNGNEGTGPTGPADPTGASAAGGDFLGGQVSALACEGRELHPGVMPGLVRLTHRQYGFAVTDLLGVESNASTEFVSDQEFYGFNNNAEKLSVAANQVSRYQATAETVAQQASANLPSLAKLSPCLLATHDDACRDDTLRRVLLLFFRRPPADAELARYRQLFVTGNEMYEEGDAFSRGVRIVLEAVLQSPAFLYRAELSDRPLDGKVVALSPYELATRMALTLWSSVPDQALLDKAQAGKLANDADVEVELRRMVDDPRTARVLDDFYAQWLEFGKLRFEKDQKSFPEYDKAAFEASAKGEALAFARNMTLKESGTLIDLFSAPVSYVDATGAKIYGVAAPASPFARTDLNPSERAGLFTQLAFLAGHADALDGSPIHRGAYVQKRVLCREFGALPANVGTLPARTAQIVTTRDQVEAKTAAPQCQACHKDINPVGFAFEMFDTLGRYRTVDHGENVDSTGTLAFGESPAVSFNGAVDFAHQLADSETATRCFELQWFRYAYGRKEGKDDACLLTQVDQKAQQSQYNLKELLVALTSSRAFRFRAQEEL